MTFFVLLPGLGNMTRSAQRLQVFRVGFSAAQVQGDDVIALQPPGLAAALATVAVTVKDALAQPGPRSCGYSVVVFAHIREGGKY